MIMATNRSPLAELAPARRTLLIALRRAGEAGAEELADGLRITPSAVRQQLRALAGRELVVHRDVAAGPGRPRRLYSLGPKAQGLFPSAHGELGSELLAYIEDEDPALLGRVFERRRKARVLDAQGRLAAATSRAASRSSRGSWTRRATSPTSSAATTAASGSRSTTARSSPSLAATGTRARRS